MNHYSLLGAVPFSVPITVRLILHSSTSLFLVSSQCFLICAHTNLWKPQGEMSRICLSTVNSFSLQDLYPSNLDVLMPPTASCRCLVFNLLQVSMLLLEKEISCVFSNVLIQLQTPFMILNRSYNLTLIF
jgi:hypothetical protein